MNLSDYLFSIYSVLRTSVNFISQDLHIKELQKLLEAVEEDDASNSTEASSASYGRTWTVRQALCHERWQKARPQLLEAMLEAGKIPKGLCQMCNFKDAVICCTDCRPKQMLCSKCDVNVHRQYSLHNRCSLVGGSYKALPPTSIIAEEASGELSLCEEGMYTFLWNICNPVILYDVPVLAR